MSVLLPGITEIKTKIGFRFYPGNQSVLKFFTVYCTILETIMNTVCIFFLILQLGTIKSKEYGY